MSKTIEVIFESGELKPVEPLEGLDEHERMFVTISDQKRRHSLADVSALCPMTMHVK